MPRGGDSNTPPISGKLNLKLQHIETRHCVDYISFSTDYWQPIDDILGQPKVVKPRIGNYMQAIQYECGCLVQWNDERPSLKQHVTLSGKTLQNWRKYGFVDTDIVGHAQSLKNTKIGRLDIAVTAYGDKIAFSPERAWELCRQGRMQSRLEADKPVVDIDKNVETFYVGSRKSRNRLLRVYDKGLELGGVAGEIIRIELESRRAANTVAKEVVEGRNMAGIIRRVVEFDDNAWRAIMDCEPLPRLRDDSAVNEKDIEAKKGWLLTSVSPAIAKLAAEIGWDDPFWDEFTEMTAFRYAQLVQDN